MVQSCQISIQLHATCVREFNGKRNFTTMLCIPPLPVSFPLLLLEMEQKKNKLECQKKNILVTDNHSMTVSAAIRIILQCLTEVLPLFYLLSWKFHFSSPVTHEMRTCCESNVQPITMIPSMRNGFQTLPKVEAYKHPYCF